MQKSKSSGQKFIKILSLLSEKVWAADIQSNNFYSNFQYPVRPCTLPYDPNTTLVMDSRMKPKQQKVELTLGLNSNCANYDQSKGKYYWVIEFLRWRVKISWIFAKAE